MCIFFAFVCMKIDNILLKGSGDNIEIKIADFGLSALVRLGEEGYDAEESGKRKKYKGLHELWGTKEYFAPELIDGAYGPQADIWSAGCILYEMLVGKTAFPFHRNERDLYERIKSKTYDTQCAEYKGLSSQARSLLNGLLTVDPVQRLSATEALKHPWILNAAERDNSHLSQAHANIKERVQSKKMDRLQARK